MAEAWQAGGFGLYVHWPFCAAKCPYCDFNTYVMGQIDHAAWQHAYLEEMDRVAALIGKRQLDSIFFGGGTPSLMSPQIVAAVIEHACDLWCPAAGIEITLEANPSSVEVGTFAAMAAAGVNRVSIGVQALDDIDLRRLGRLHTVREALGAIEVGQRVFSRVSIDVIYARQDQAVADWKAELRRVLALGLGHLSLYQLTIEPGTVFGARHRQGHLRGLPDEDASARLYEVTQAQCYEAGLVAYEVSNHAWPGECACHNLIYWRCGDYAGIGPGAHGRLSYEGRRYASVQAHHPAKWLAGARQEDWQELAEAAQAEEVLLMGMRLDEGVDLGRLRKLGLAFDSAELGRLVSEGWIVWKGDRLAVTPRGRLLLNAVLVRLMGNSRANLIHPN